MLEFRLFFDLTLSKRQSSRNKTTHSSNVIGERENVPRGASSRQLATSPPTSNLVTDRRPEASVPTSATQRLDLCW